MLLRSGVLGMLLNRVKYRNCEQSHNRRKAIYIASRETRSDDAPFLLMRKQPLVDDAIGQTR